MPKDDKDFAAKFAKIQSEIRVEKSRFNEFGGFSFRSCEDILEAAKKIVNSMGMFITMSDTVELIGDRYYVKSTASITDGDTCVSVDAFAREQEKRKGMDESQVTGAASSYARKYALSALLGISAGGDADELYNMSDDPRRVPPTIIQTNELAEAKKRLLRVAQVAYGDDAVSMIKTMQSSDPQFADEPAWYTAMAVKLEAGVYGPAE